LGYDIDIPQFSPPSGSAENLTCQLLIAGGGLSGLSAAEAAARQGVDVIVIEKRVFGQQTASGLNAGQFLTGWVKPVDIMLSELAQQERERGLRGEQAQLQAQRRVRAFLRRTVEGCQRLSALDREYNLDASVLHGVTIAAVSGQDLANLKSGYEFMKRSNLSSLMPSSKRQQKGFYLALDARELQKRCGIAEGHYAGGIIDFFGGSFEPRKLLHGLARSLHERGVRFLQNTEAQALDFADNHMTIFCGSGTAIRANTLFMANAYARHINGDIHERTIFTYNYVVEVKLPDGADVLPSEKVFSDTRDPCFYARRQGQRLYMGFEETAETSPEITQQIARRTLEEGQRIFPALHRLRERDICNAWWGAIYYTLDDYPFVERRHGGRVITFAAPSDHGNSLAARVGQIVGNLAAASRHQAGGEKDKRRRRRELHQLRLFEGFPKGMRLRPGMRYQEAASPGSTAHTSSEQ
jgi:gamma-glutamylputrescine oxidase